MANIPTKTVTVATNWHDEIGYKVGDLIAYLQQFPIDAEFSISIDGDTHGCDLYSDITVKVPLTAEEIKQNRIDYLNKKISDTLTRIKFYEQRNTPERIADLKFHEKLAQYEAELKQLTES